MMREPGELKIELKKLRSLNSLSGGIGVLAYIHCLCWVLEGDDKMLSPSSAVSMAMQRVRSMDMQRLADQLDEMKKMLERTDNMRFTKGNFSDPNE